MISLNHVVAHAFRWVPLPFIILYNLIISPFNWRTKNKRPKRIMLEAAIRWIGWCQLVMPLPPWKEPPSDESYKAWCLKRNVEEDVEELGLNAKLFWIGRKAGRDGDSRVAPGKVILYFHGGAYVMGLNGAVIDYANYIRKEASKGLKGDKNEECIGLALLGYTLVPDAAFPTQLHQAILAVQSLLDKGIKPSNVILMGDSAGGNLIAQLLGHMLHPMPAHTDIPKLPIIDPKVKFAGAFLQSPWANLAPEKEGILKGTWKTNLGHDILSRDSLAYAGEQVFEALHRNPSLLSTLYPYITFPAAPLDWWDRVDTKVGKVLISAGELEVMCDEIIEFGGCLGKVHRDVEVMVIKGGIHNDPTFDFLFEGEDEAKRASRKELKRIVEWTKGVFEHS